MGDHVGWKNKCICGFICLELFLRGTGYRRVVLKSDGEPSIKALKEEVRSKASGIEVVVRETRTGDKRSNGTAEVAERETKRQCRALLSTLN